MAMGLHEAIGMCRAVLSRTVGGFYRMHFRVNRRLRILLVAVLIVILYGLFWLERPTVTGQLKLPGGRVPPQVSIGSSHGMILAPDGSIWTWGGEDSGWPVLGLGTTNFSAVLRRIGSETNWTCVSAGQDHNLALKSDGTIWAWGANYKSQLGDGTQTTRNSPVPSVPGNDWTQVVAGFVSSYALKKDGTLWAWGLNNFGQLGIGSWANSPTAVQVGLATNWVKIRVGGVSAGGIQSDGSLWIWGGSPKLGNTAPQKAENFLVPTRFSPDNNWVDLSVAFNIWLAIKSDGTLWAWGRNAHVFTGASASAGDAPQQIGTNTDWQACTSSGGGFYHVLRKRGGTFWVMDAPDHTHQSLRLRLVGVPKDVASFWAGGGAIAIVTPNGEVWTCGTDLGKHEWKDRFLKFLAERCWRFGWKVQWGQNSKPIIRDKPWQLRNIDPNVSAAK